MQRAMQLFTKRLKLPFLVQGACDHLIPDLTGQGIAKADVIIERYLGLTPIVLTLLSTEITLE